MDPIWATKKPSLFPQITIRLLLQSRKLRLYLKTCSWDWVWVSQPVREAETALWQLQILMASSPNCRMNSGPLSDQSISLFPEERCRNTRVRSVWTGKWSILLIDPVNNNRNETFLLIATITRKWPPSSSRDAYWLRRLREISEFGMEGKSTKSFLEALFSHLVLSFLVLTGGRDRQLAVHSRYYQWLTRNCAGCFVRTLHFSS